MLFFDFGAETTAVAAISTAAAGTATYNLLGQRVAGQKRGLYIVGGKKCLYK